VTNPPTKTRRAFFRIYISEDQENASQAYGRHFRPFQRTEMDRFGKEVAMIEMMKQAFVKKEDFRATSANNNRFFFVRYARREANRYAECWMVLPSGWCSSSEKETQPTKGRAERNGTVPAALPPRKRAQAVTLAAENSEVITSGFTLLIIYFEAAACGRARRAGSLFDTGAGAVSKSKKHDTATIYLYSIPTPTDQPLSPDDSFSRSSSPSC